MLTLTEEQVRSKFPQLEYIYFTASATHYAVLVGYYHRAFYAFVLYKGDIHIKELPEADNFYAAVHNAVRSIAGYGHFTVSQRPKPTGDKQDIIFYHDLAFTKCDCGSSVVLSKSVFNARVFKGRCECGRFADYFEGRL